MATVSVGCKLPHGLIFDLNGKRYTFAGVKSTLAAKMGITVDAPWGVTHGVDASVWEEFKKQFKDVDFMKKGLVFANEKAIAIEAYIKESAGMKSGFEGLTEADMRRSSKNLAVLDKA